MESRDKFAQMIKEGYRELDPDREEREYMRELLRQKEKERIRRRKKITAVAAAFVLVLCAVMTVGGFFNHVEADKNDNTKIEDIISGENADGHEVMAQTAQVTDWDKVDKLKTKYPEMITFTDIPEGMEFVSVEVTSYSKSNKTILYKFVADDNECCVFQRVLKGNESTNILEYEADNVKNCNGYEVYVSSDNGWLTGTTVTEKNKINVLGEIEEQDLINVFECISEN